MAPDHIDLISAWAGLRVLVLGEAMLDRYLHGSASRLSPEAPVPVVAVSGRDEAPGGAANTAVNVAALGGSPTLLSVLGVDSEGQALTEALAGYGVDAQNVFSNSARQTSTKQRVVAGSQMVVRFDEGSTEPIDAETEGQLVDRLRELWSDHDAVVVSDYDYGIVTSAVISALVHLQAEYPKVLVVDSKRLTAFRDAEPTAVKPNYEQSVQLVGAARFPGCSNRWEAVGECADLILDKTRARIAAVTLDRDGALILERGQPPHHTHSRATQHPTTAGAGDTFAAALALALAAGGATTDAADLATAAAAIVVGKDGTAACSAQELLRSLVPAGILWDLASLSAEVERQRAAGKRIVLTNGCFDVIHTGHVEYLTRARGLGDLLIVGVNSDDGVRRLKGPSRPVNGLEDRARVLAALACVDHVVAFDEDTPVDLVRRLRPDVFVKGGDYTIERLPEAPVVRELGGEVRILPHVAGRSTTNILQRVHEANSSTLVG